MNKVVSDINTGKWHSSDNNGGSVNKCCYNDCDESALNHCFFT